MLATQNLNSSINRGQDKNDYYTSTGRKIGDFCIGFFGIFIVASVLSTITMLVFFNAFIVSIILLFIVVFGVIFSFKKGRRYIGIGIIASTLVPLLFLGACMIMFAGGGGW